MAEGAAFLINSVDDIEEYYGVDQNTGETLEREALVDIIA
jgi:hypothetical protein